MFTWWNILDIVDLYLHLQYFYLTITYLTISMNKFVYNIVTSKLRTHGAEGVNTAGTEFLIDLVASKLWITRELWRRSDANREVIRFVLGLMRSREKSHSRSMLHWADSQNECTYLRGTNWVSVPRGRILTPDVSVRLCVLSFDYGT